MIGRIFMGRYEAVRLLGEGGMGKVYLARQLDLGRQVVVKVMHESIAADPHFRERFQRETLLMARFQHPYAVSLFDASLNDPNGPCIVMEYIKGVNLDQLLAKNGRFSPARVGRILGQLCEVLQAAHSEGIIHRDLKPSNLMVIDADSPRERIKVMDFGLAKMMEASPILKNITDTNVDFSVGTPAYICPEQVRGEPSDHRSDIYSVGVMLYELLTGRLPFMGTSSMEMMLAHATDQPPSFNELDLPEAIPQAIEKVVFACLEKDPKKRPQSARDLAERYETALAHEQYLMETASPPQAVAGAGLPNAAVAEEGPLPEDPNALNFQMEAWMPETIAIMKLRGFVHDFGGEVIESVPGMIKVRLGAVRGGRIRRGPIALQWLGFGLRSNPIDVELRMFQVDAAKANQLLIQVFFRPSHASLLNDSVWRDRATKIFLELRAYLMGR